MATFKNPFGEARDVPALDLRIGVDETFEVPDDLAAAFEAQGYAPSRTKSPDVTVEPAAAEALTGPITVSPETVSPAPTTTTN